MLLSSLPPNLFHAEFQPFEIEEWIAWMMDWGKEGTQEDACLALVGTILSNLQSKMDAHPLILK